MGKGRDARQADGALDAGGVVLAISGQAILTADREARHREIGLGRRIRSHLELLVAVRCADQESTALLHCVLQIPVRRSLQLGGVFQSSFRTLALVCCVLRFGDAVQLVARPLVTSHLSTDQYVDCLVSVNSGTQRPSSSAPPIHALPFHFYRA